MAVFGTDKAPQLGDVSDFSNMSKGFRDRSTAALVEGAAGVVDAANEGVEAYVDNDIQTQLEKGVETIETDIGLRPLSDEASVPEGLNRQFQRFQNFFDAAETARGPGASQTYFKRLDTLVRDVRNQYPGFAPEIDKKIQQITGFDPHNRLISSIFAKAEESQRAAQDAERDWQRFSNSDEFVSVYGAAAQLNPERFATPDQRRLAMAKVNTVRAQRLQLKSEQELVEADQSLKEQNANAQAEQIVTEAFSALAESQPKLASGDINMNPEEQRQAAAGIAQYKQMVASKLTQTLSEINLPLDEKQKIIDNAMKRFDAFEATLGFSPSAAKRSVEFNAARLAGDKEALYRSHPDARIQKVIIDEFGHDIADDYMEKIAPTGTESNWVSHANRANFFDIAGGNSTVAQMMTELKGSGKSPAERSAVARTVPIQTKASILDARVPEDVRRNQARGVFSQRGVEATMFSMDSGQSEYYLFMTDPTMTKAIAGFGDASLSADYQRTLASAFDLKEFNELKNELNASLNTGPHLTRELVYANGQLSFKEGQPKTRAGVSMQGRLNPGMPALNKVNQILRNVYAGIKEFGGDPDQEILLGLQGAGIQVKPPEEPEGKKE